MLNVKCPAEYLQKVRDFAKSINKSEHFEEQLNYLGTYACGGDRPNDHTRCDLFTDFADHSFAFSMYRKDESGEYKYWFNGGLIFHPGATGVDRSFSVELCPSREPHWSVHT